MKYIKQSLILVFVATMFSFGYAQLPNSFGYQGVISQGKAALENKEIAVRITLYEKSTNTNYYKETHQTKTNAIGFFSLEIGNGAVASGSGKWAKIPWSTSQISMKVEVDSLRNGNYYIFNDAMLLSVPYAMYANKIVGDDGTDEFKVFKVEDAFYIVSKKNPTDTLMTILEDGRIGVGMTQPRDGIELAVNKRIHLSSEEWHLNTSGVITMQALNDTAKPALTWFDEAGNIHAAMTTYDRERIDPIHHKQFVIETDDSSGNMLPRFAIPYHSDWTEIRTHNSNLRIGDKGNFYVGRLNSAGNAYIFGNSFIGKRLGIGEKDWEGLSTPFNSSTSNVEVYNKSGVAEILVHQEDGEHAAKISLQKGDHTWGIENKGNLAFTYDNNDILVVDSNQRVGINTASPQEALDVNGNISSRGSVIAQNTGYACYFEVETAVATEDVVGVDPTNGVVRTYQNGDIYLGIACESAAVVANYTADKKDNDNWVLVALKGIVNIDASQIKTNGNLVSTSDGTEIGVMLSSGEVFLK